MSGIFTDPPIFGGLCNANIQANRNTPLNLLEPDVQKPSQVRIISRDTDGILCEFTSYDSKVTSAVLAYTVFGTGETGTVNATLYTINTYRAVMPYLGLSQLNNEDDPIVQVQGVVDELSGDPINIIDGQQPSDMGIVEQFKQITGTYNSATFEFIFIPVNTSIVAKYFGILLKPEDADLEFILADQIGVGRYRATFTLPTVRSQIFYDTCAFVRNDDQSVSVISEKAIKICMYPTVVVPIDIVVVTNESNNVVINYNCRSQKPYVGEVTLKASLLFGRNPPSTKVIGVYTRGIKELILSDMFPNTEYSLRFLCESAYSKEYSEVIKFTTLA